MSPAQSSSRISAIRELTVRRCSRAHRLEAAATHGSTCPVSATKFRLGHGGNVGTVLTVGKHALLHPLPIFGPMFVAELYQNRIIGWRT